MSERHVNERWGSYLGKLGNWVSDMILAESYCVFFVIFCFVNAVTRCHFETLLGVVEISHRAALGRSL